MVSIGNEEPHKRERDKIEERNAPEDLFAGCGQGASRVRRLGSGKADEFGTAE